MSDFGVLPTDAPGLHVLYERSPDRQTLTLHHVQTELDGNRLGTILALPAGWRTERA